MFQSGDDGWMTIPDVSKGASGDICNFKGRICVVDDIGRTVMVGPDLSIDFMADPFNCYKARLCLVESELLLVDMWRDFIEDDV
ncbi:F-box protein, partial [Trifolium medium]|nr:F-box protein [Trifolium medium]